MVSPIAGRTNPRPKMPGQPNEWVKVAINAISTFLAKLAVELVWRWFGPHP